MEAAGGRSVCRHCERGELVVYPIVLQGDAYVGSSAIVYIVYLVIAGGFTFVWIFLSHLPIFGSYVLSRVN